MSFPLPRVIRFVKFSAVGAMGNVVQLTTLALLISGLGMNYAVATPLAVEAAIVQNFCWHEGWTWRERTRSGSALLHPNTRNTGACWGPRTLRLLRFHLANGAISLAGNIVLMPVFVEMLGLHYLVANLLSITACWLLNFVIADRWVFGKANASVVEVRV